MSIEIDYVLDGTPTMTELAEFFTQGEEEKYTVPAIKKHLRTPEAGETADIPVDLPCLTLGTRVPIGWSQGRHVTDTSICGSVNRTITPTT